MVMTKAKNTKKCYFLSVFDPSRLAPHQQIIAVAINLTFSYNYHVIVAAAFNPIAIPPIVIPSFATS